MVIDACMFSGELDMLEFRLRVLWDVVDKFLVIEGDKTFTGIPRTWEASFNSRFDWARSKLIPTRIVLQGQDPWTRERFQRNSIRAACKQFAPSDIVILGDVDEIPSREVVEQIKQNPGGFPKVCYQAALMYKLKFFGDDYWHGSIFSTVERMQKMWPQAIRDRRGGWLKIDKAGWHCTYFGGVSAIQNKLRSFSHQEMNTPERLDGKYLSDCINTGKNLLGRAGTVTVVGPEFFPDYVVENAKPYGWLE